MLFVLLQTLAFEYIFLLLRLLFVLLSGRRVPGSNFVFEPAYFPLLDPVPKRCLDVVT